MHIVAIGWLYVTALMALTESSAVAGVLTFLFYGVLPTTLSWWLSGGRKRHHRRAPRSEEPSPDARQSTRER
ncbi:MAG TPA: hypothetical protein PLS67_04285 [Accumulibacter sp.]|jgi:hypothetical protein|nr:hypothetical protein [Accumulibacter sp.]HQC79725.1 hypothetical protein [Accumulibacter sp.]